uniref:Uncharacterized protein n=1 Tax=Arundo donax TaxID=35708 RepID=A0A0A8YFT1_ARUDO
MRSPIAAGWSRLPRLFEMDGTLGISRVNESKTAIKLWVLQDYATEVWSLKYRIKLPVLQLRRIAKDWSLDDGMVVSENGDVLVTSLHSSHLFLCDRKGKLLDKFSWDRESPTPTGHWFRESLVWHHEFLERQDGGRVRWPRFFKGL